jgi:transcriptional regulator with XRE-family HTH domain
LRMWRSRARLSQEDLAQRSTISERTVRNLESGRARVPHRDTARLLADGMGLSRRTASPSDTQWRARQASSSAWITRPADDRKCLTTTIPGPGARQIYNGPPASGPAVSPAIRPVLSLRQRVGRTGRPTRNARSGTGRQCARGVAQ